MKDKDDRLSCCKRRSSKIEIEEIADVGHESVFTEKTTVVARSLPK